MALNSKRLDLRDLPDLGTARALWQRNEFKRALRSFEKVARKHPNNINALADAARSFGSRFDLEKANRYLERLEALAGKNAAAFLLCGQSHRMIHQADPAIRCLRKAVELDPALIEGHMEMAVLLERTHRLDEALEHIDQCEELKSGLPEVRLIRCRVMIRQEKWEEVLPLLAELGAAPNHQVIRTEALALQGQVADRRGDYGDAFQSMEQRAGLLKQGAAPFVERAEFEEHHLQSLVRSLDAEKLSSWLGEESEGPVPVLLTGAPRSGTTLLMRMMDAHPQIAAADERELISGVVLPGLVESIRPQPEALEFEHWDGLPSATSFRLGRDYRERLADCCGAGEETRVLVDKNPSITLMIPAFLRINPGGKVVQALRDPRDVVLSCFFRQLPLNSVSVRFLDVAATARRIRMELEAWLRLRDLLPKDRWVEVRYEDVVEDAEGEMRRVLEILGLEWSGEVIDYRERNVEKLVRSPTYAEVSKPITKSAVGRWRNYERELGEALQILEPVCRELGYD